MWFILSWWLWPLRCMREHISCRGCIHPSLQELPWGFLDASLFPAAQTRQLDKPLHKCLYHCICSNLQQQWVCFPSAMSRVSELLFFLFIFPRREFKNFRRILFNRTLTLIPCLAASSCRTLFHSCLIRKVRVMVFFRLSKPLTLLKAEQLHYSLKNNWQHISNWHLIQNLFKRFYG